MALRFNAGLKFPRFTCHVERGRKPKVETPLRRWTAELSKGVFTEHHNHWATFWKLTAAFVPVVAAQGSFDSAVRSRKAGSTRSAHDDI